LEFACTLKFKLSIKCAFNGRAFRIPKNGYVGLGVLLFFATVS